MKAPCLPQLNQPYHEKHTGIQKVLKNVIRIAQLVDSLRLHDVFPTPYLFFKHNIDTKITNVRAKLSLMGNSQENSKSRDFKI